MNKQRGFTLPMAGFRRNNQAGFTFLELMVAVVVLVLGVLITLGMFARASLTLKKNKELSIANLLAQKVMERTIYQTGEEIQTNSVTVNPSGNNFLNFSEVSYKNYKYKVELGTPADSALSDFSTVKVTILTPLGSEVDLVGLKYSSSIFTGAVISLYNPPPSGEPQYILVLDSEGQIIKQSAPIRGGILFDLSPDKKKVLLYTDTFTINGVNYTSGLYYWDPEGNFHLIKKQNEIGVNHNIGYWVDNNNCTVLGSGGVKVVNIQTGNMTTIPSAGASNINLLNSNPSSGKITYINYYSGWKSEIYSYDINSNSAQRILEDLILANPIVNESDGIRTRKELMEISYSPDKSKIASVIVKLTLLEGQDPYNTYSWRKTDLEFWITDVASGTSSKVTKPAGTYEVPQVLGGGTFMLPPPLWTDTGEKVVFPDRSAISYDDSGEVLGFKLWVVNPSDNFNAVHAGDAPIYFTYGSLNNPSQPAGSDSPIGTYTTSTSINYQTEFTFFTAGNSKLIYQTNCGMPSILQSMDFNGSNFSNPKLFRYCMQLPYQYPIPVK